MHDHRAHIDLAEMAKDPVCGMNVDPAESKHRTEHDGQSFHFCCAGCKARFEIDPERYLAKVVAKEGAKHGVRANVICPGFVRTPLVDRQIPEQANLLGISEQAVIRDVMLKDTVDGQFTTVEDVAEVALLFASFPSNALTGQSLVVSHGWHMQ